VSQDDLFPNPSPPRDPARTETVCEICHQPLLRIQGGVPRHRRGDGKKCREILEESRKSRNPGARSKAARERVERDPGQMRTIGQKGAKARARNFARNFEKGPEGGQ